jgi:hypothetical protein
MYKLELYLYLYTLLLLKGFVNIFQKRYFIYMKKISVLLPLFLLFISFGCDNEPLEIELNDPSGVSCDEAIANTTAAALAFIDATEENYTQLCTTYSNALQVQIDACGDPTSEFQQQLDALGSCTNNPIENCDTATEALSVAQLIFENAPDEDYTESCNAYKTALQNFITLCGDPDGSVQQTLDDLGDCMQEAQDVEISLTAGTLPIEFDMVTVVEEGNLLKVTGETSSTSNDYMVYFEVNLGDTGVDIINSTFELTLISVYFPSSPGIDDFTSEITENTSETIIGTFNGFMENNDGGDLSITSGVINISY